MASLSVVTPGEDWSNSALILSTVASDMAAKTVPRLRAVKIQEQGARIFGQPTKNSNNFQKPDGAFGVPKFSALARQSQEQQQQMQMQMFQQAAQKPQAGAHSLLGGGLFGSTGTSAATTRAFGGGFGAVQPAVSYAGFGSSAPEPQEEEDEVFEEVINPSSPFEPTTVVTESPLSVSYSVEGASTIPSDGIAHQVSIAVLTFESNVTHVCSPRIEPRVYLQVSRSISSLSRKKKVNMCYQLVRSEEHKRLQTSPWTR